jgi:hypothetical protein
MVAFLKRGFLQSENAVDSPKTPLPTIRTEVGISTDCEEAIVKPILEIEDETTGFEMI